MEEERVEPNAKRDKRLKSENTKSEALHLNPKVARDYPRYIYNGRAMPGPAADDLVCKLCSKKGTEAPVDDSDATQTSSSTTGTAREP